MAPTKTKRLCDDISIDSTTSNTLLPAYSSMHNPITARIFECGCPDAISKDGSQITQLPVIIHEVINTSGRKHLGESIMLIKTEEWAGSSPQLVIHSLAM